MEIRTALSVFTAMLALCVTAADLPPGIDPIKAGEELARELREAVPGENAEFTGTLVMYKGDKSNAVPIRCKIDMRDSGWTVTYGTKAGGQQPPQRLSIKHGPNQPNVYLYAEGKDLDKVRQLKPQELTLPLAGSDFYLMDLGLDFFHWPKQRLIKHEMRRSRSCRVLESANPSPTPGAYSRVLSWIDVESDGLLRAEAYDAKSELQKVFEVGSFKKLRGKWQLQELKIRNQKARTRTELHFDLESDRQSQ
jgi:hypothetical protein